MSLPILKSSLTNPDGSPSPLLLNKERGKRALAKAKARKHLLDFTQYTSPDYNTNWHHKIICDYLERWAFGDLKRLMIFMPPGSGKPLSIDTPVLMYNGIYKKLGDIQINDVVINGNGEPDVVKEIYDQGELECLEISTYHGRKCITAYDHTFLTSDGWKNASELELGDYLAISTNQKIQPAATNTLDEFIIAGYFIGDGSTNSNNQGSNSSNFTNADQIIIKDFTKHIEKLGFKWYKSPHGKYRYDVIGGIKQWLRNKGLVGTSYTKRIPEWIYKGTNEQIAAFIGSYFSCDGYIGLKNSDRNNCTIMLYSVSRDLLRSIQSLMLRLGISTTLRQKNSKYKGKPYISWSLNISDATNSYLFKKYIRLIGSKKNKLSNWNVKANRFVDNRYDADRIVSIIPVGKHKCRCIEIENDHTFTANDIVVHNSELVSRRLPAWIFGKNPNVGIMATSYAASLVEDMNIDVQRIMDSDAYREVFPEVSLSSRNGRNSLVGSTASRNRGNFEIVGHKGYYKCAGVGGSITGKRFFYGIIDDPLRGRQDAESITIRNTTYNWYVNDFYTRRLNQDARILITLTRWHADDLAGRLLSLAASNPKAEQWTVLKFPMIAEDPLELEDPRQIGECLWSWRYGSLEDIEATKISAGTYTWSSLYQQRPSPPGGTIFNRGWWGDPIAVPPNRNQFYPAEPLSLQNHMDIVVLSADCTFKETDGTDYVVIQIWGRKGGDFYLLDQKRDRMDIITTMQNIRTLSAKWPRVTAKLIEDKANGPAVITMLKRELPGLIPIEPQGGKVVRAQAITPYIESGNVWLPQPKNAPWLHDLLEELAAFPTSRHDDQVDALTQAIFYLNNRSNFVLPKLPKKAIRLGGGWEG